MGAWALSLLVPAGVAAAADTGKAPVNGQPTPVAASSQPDATGPAAAHTGRVRLTVATKDAQAHPPVPAKSPGTTEYCDFECPPCDYDCPPQDYYCNTFLNSSTGGVSQDEFLEEVGNPDYFAGTDCNFQLDYIYFYAGLVDRSPDFNGESFNGNVLSDSPAYQAYYAYSGGSSGSARIEAHRYNGGRIVQTVVDTYLAAPYGVVWTGCSAGFLVNLEACDGLGTSFLHMALSTQPAYTGLTRACRDQRSGTSGLDAEQNRLFTRSGSAPASTQIVRFVPSIEQKVIEFKRDLCNTVTSPSLASSFVWARGRSLWDTAVTEAQRNTAYGDDRPLYWARLNMTAALREWRPSFAVDSAWERDLDKTSRGMTSHDFTTSGAKAFVSGFDPFDLDGDILRSNPSGAIALQLDGRTVGGAEIQAVVFPVRYDDFDAGLVEEVFGQHLVPGPQMATVANTVSQGDSMFEREIWNGRRRSDDVYFESGVAHYFYDNRHRLSGGTDDSPVVPPGLTSSELPEFVQSTLPPITECGCAPNYGQTNDDSVTDMAPPPFQTIPQNHTGGPNPGYIAVDGSGGGFLSNEIAYRVTLRRQQLGSPTLAGHIHTPVLASALEPVVNSSNRNRIISQYVTILRGLLGPSSTGPAAMGISFYPDGDPGQCGGPTQQWMASGSWTTPIRFDTDSRTGGCQLAFGVHDETLDFAGLALSYRWEVSPGGDGRQCGNQGEFQAPVTPFYNFGPTVRVDTDSKPGGCNLTFTVSGRTDVELDVQYWPDGDGGQCINTLPQGQWRAVTAGVPLTIGIDADGRTGGCQLSLKLRKR